MDVVMKNPLDDNRQTTDTDNIIQQYAPSLIKLQQLALWHDPVSSIMALVLVSIGYLCLSTCPMLYLVAWIGLITCLYTTCVDRIWPEIRLPHDDSPSTPIHSDYLTAPEISVALRTHQAKVQRAWNAMADLRAGRPGMFCIYIVGMLSIVAWLGTRIDTVGMVYLGVVMGLTVPAILKFLKTQPASQDLISDMSNIIGPYLASFSLDSDAADHIGSSPVVVAPITEQPKAYTSQASELNSVGSKLVSRSSTDSEDEMKECLPEKVLLSEEKDKAETNTIPVCDNDDAEMQLIHGGVLKESAEEDESFPATLPVESHSTASYMPDPVSLPVMTTSSDNVPEQLNSLIKDSFQRSPSVGSEESCSEEDFEIISEEELQMVEM